MLVELAGAICGFLGSPLFGGSGQVFSIGGPEVLRQVWLPNGAHLSMLHTINLRYTFARADEGSTRTEALRALGRACGYMFREAGRADEVSVIDASQGLREAFTFPVDDIRGQHLGLLTTYLRGSSDPSSLKKEVKIAERQPISPTLDPALERDELAPLVDDYNSAHREGDVASSKKLGAAIGEVLADEIARRLSLTLEAARILRNDARPVNPGVGDLVRGSLDTKRREYLNLEQAIAGGENAWGAPSAETDRQAKSAARRFIRMAGGEEARTRALLMNDREMIDDAIAAGDGIRGTVVNIERRIPQGKKRAATFWVVEIPLSAPFRLKVDAELRTIDEVPPGGYIEAIKFQGQARLVSVCMNKRSSGTPPDHESFRGKTVTLLPLPGMFVESKLRNLGREPGPGAWATGNGGVRPTPDTSYDGDPLEEIESLRKA